MLELKSLDESEQLKLLLQQYTSQITSHAGYILTSAIGVLSAIQLFFIPTTTWPCVARFTVYFAEFIFLEGAIFFIFHFFLRSLYYNELVNICMAFLGMQRLEIYREYLPWISAFNDRYGMSTIVICEFYYRIGDAQKTDKDGKKDEYARGRFGRLMGCYFHPDETSIGRVLKDWTKLRNERRVRLLPTRHQ